MNENNLPTLAELTDSTELALKENKLMVLLNQPPPEKWLKVHPIIVGHRYLPIERVEYLMNRIFSRWWVEIIDSKVVANSMVVQVRLFALNPITGEVEHQDGIGAAPIQTKKGAGAMDWNQAQTSGVQMAAPMAKSYAFKDAAESFGKLFGKDASRKNQIDYNELLKTDKKITLEMLKSMYQEKGILASQSDFETIGNAIEECLESEYERMYNYLSKLKADVNS